MSHNYPALRVNTAAPNGRFYKEVFEKANKEIQMKAHQAKKMYGIPTRVFQ